MANSKLTGLTEATSLATTDEIYAVVGGNSRRASVQTLLKTEASLVTITGGTIDGTVIGGVTPAAADFTTMNTTGNVGIGVTPSGWSVGTAIEMRTKGNSVFTNGSGEMLTTANAYYNGGWKYGTSGAAAKYIVGNTNGTYIWQNAASGSADAAITWSESMRIDASGNVGIGATSPNNSRLRLDNGGTSGAPQLMITATGATTQTELRHDTSNNLIFDNWGGSSRTERMRIDSSGHAIIPAGVTLGTAAGVYAAANTLDDYEEGTWVPVFAFGGASVGQTYGAAIGAYTKIGNLVTVSAYLVLTALGSSTGNATITGLPFTSGNVGSRRTAGSLGDLLAISFADVPNAIILENSAVIYLLETTNAGNTTALTDGNFANNSGLKISFSYRV